MKKIVYFRQFWVKECLESFRNHFDTKSATSIVTLVEIESDMFVFVLKVIVLFIVPLPNRT